MSRYSELFWTMFFFLIIISCCAASSHTEDELGSGQNDAEVSMNVIQNHRLRMNHTQQLHILILLGVFSMENKAIDKEIQPFNL